LNDCFGRSFEQRQVELDITLGGAGPHPIGTVIRIIVIARTRSLFGSLLARTITKSCGKSGGGVVTLNLALSGSPRFSTSLRMSLSRCGNLKSIASGLSMMVKTWSCPFWILRKIGCGSIVSMVADPRCKSLSRRKVQDGLVS
jgi:hypothetical protein